MQRIPGYGVPGRGGVGISNASLLIPGDSAAREQFLMGCLCDRHFIRSGSETPTYLGMGGQV